jgi:hypothetical protein
MLLLRHYEWEHSCLQARDHLLYQLATICVELHRSKQICFNLTFPIRDALYTRIWEGWGVGVLNL